MLASRLHWRILIATILLLMAAAFIAPRFVRAPDIDENRVLASRPAWPEDLAGFRAFRKDADKYVADKFPVRPHLIGLLNRARMVFGVSGSPRVVVGREGWLFFDGGDHMAATQDPSPPPADTRAWLAGLAGRTEALRARGVPYLVLVPPMQEAVYPQHAPGWYRLNPDRRAVRFAELARTTGAGDVIYLHEAMVAATRRGVATYSRHDTHWTGPGAWEGYAALMRRLKQLGVVTEDPRPVSNFQELRPGHPNKPRNLALMLGVASFVDVDYLELGDPATEARSTTTWLDPVHDWTKPHVIETGETGKPVLMMTMDSFSNALVPFLYSHFSRIVLSHTQDGSWREDLIAQFNPDAVVLEVLESGLGYSLSPAPPASAEAMTRIVQAVPLTQPVAAPAAAAQAAAPPPPPQVPVLAPITPATTALLAAAVPTPSCNLEAASLAPAPNGVEVSVSGWISELADRNTSPVGWVRLQGPEGDYAAPLRVDQPRVDVATHFKAPKAAEASGFSAVYRIEAPKAGTYTPLVYRRTPTGWMVCRGVQALTPP
ncbi:alginate O-acetyltransferase AlgX-related protein [Phenylobacterium sp.]|uniref:alginate O-acetyltransferase AlgX-related protein n=1 Tax=Phenylobacterium sp. TaxID=1871053 RepID=UPI002FE3F87C